MRLALDAMGGDFSPGAAVEGAFSFAEDHPAHAVVLVGDQARVRDAMPRGKRPRNIDLQHASETIEMGDPPSVAIRRKKDSSLRVCFELIKAGNAGAMVSAGNSGAVMAGALMILGRITGVERPAIAALFPGLKGSGRCLLLDAGANVDCKAVHLAQFALMGDTYVRKLLGVASPRVAVLSNGEEDSKGTALTRASAALLRQSDLRFVGYVEGKDIFSGDVDVVVTDGFTGNVVLKTSEGTAMAVTGMVRTAVERAGLSEKLGALLLKSTFAGLRRVVDYAEYGGAPLLGVEGVGIVAHGRSTPTAIKNALKAALQIAEAQLRQALASRIGSAQAWLPSARRR